MRLAMLLIAAAAVLSAARTPITHEAIWLMKRIGPPVVSPDGRSVVFSVVEPAYDDKDQASDLWIAATDGSGRPRRLTSTKSGESGVAWSHDNRRIAFSARRDGDEASQIYVLDITGGEAVRVTSISTGAASPRFSPNGRQLLFQSTVYPGAADDDASKKIAAERKALKYRARVYDGFPIRQWDKWLDDTQAHVFVQAAEPGAKARDLLAGSKMVSNAGFAGAPSLTGQDLQAVWSPDGQSVIFAASVNRNASAYADTQTHLYQLSADGGEPRQITRGADSHSAPRFSPDGRSLYAIHTRQSEKVYHLDRVARFDWPAASERTLVTSRLDRSITSFGLSADSRTLYALAEEHGYEKLFAVPATGGDARVVVTPSAGVYTNVSIAGGVLAANWESAVNPAEIVRLDPVAGNHRTLSGFNDERETQIDWQPVRHFWFTSAGGKKVHNMIALPPAFDEKKKYPLLVLIHGGPHGMWRDQFFLRWNYHLLAAPGYVVLMTNYTGSTGFGEAFAQEIQGDPLHGPGLEINQAADEAIKRFAFIDGSRQAAGGASYGGHMANWLQATTTRYKCLISHAGLINLESQWGTSDMIYHREVNNGGPVWEQGKIWREQNPIRLAKNFRTPILLTVGESDFRVPLNQTIENWSVLQRLRIPSRLIVFPEENHWILKGENSRFFYQELHAWLKKWL